MGSLLANNTSIRTSRGLVQIVGSAKEVDGALWKRTLSRRCLDARYYEILEETFPDRFEFHDAILTEATTGTTAVQSFFFVDQKITAGLPARFRPAKIPGRLDRLLNIKMAVVGCAAGEGELDCDAPWAVEGLAEALFYYAKKNRAGIVVFKDFPANRPGLAGLTRHGYKRIPSMPAATLELDFSSFDEYTRTKLGGGFRSNLRRKLRDNDTGRARARRCGGCRPFP